MTTIATADQITDQQMTRYIAMIYDRTGIQIAPEKKALVSNRLRKRLRANNINCFDEYFAILSLCKPSDPEWLQFLQEITTHETHLFRDMNQWDWFRNEFLPGKKRAIAEKAGDKSLRIWSAACSTGDEPYTIATCIAASNLFSPDWKIDIVATDIGIGALESARAASFNNRAMRMVPPELRRRHFDSRAEGIWTPKKELSRWIEFRHHNLMHPLKVAPFDLIVIKNVLIYFDADSKRKVLSHVNRLLKPGGKLLSGPAEGIGELVASYERDKTWLHTKAGKSK